MRHYTYDGLGRLIKTTAPDNFTNRVEHHHYDGVRRVQTVVVSGLMSGGGALSSGDPELEQLALESEPPNESIEPENTNLAFASGQMGLTGQTFTVYREYVWGQGDAGVDEILVYYDSGDSAWWCLTDLTGDLIAVCDLNGAGGTARVVAQWTYDAYGSVMSADHIHSFERPNLGHKGLFLDRLDLANPLGPQLVPFAQSVYHNRNRAYRPIHGRFLQSDPNATAAKLLEGPAYYGRSGLTVGLDELDIERQYADGASLYQYLRSGPWMRTDPMGLYADLLGGWLPDPTDFISGSLEALFQGYADNLMFDVEWAMDWDLPDDDHSRTDDGWVNYTLAEGLYDSFYVGIPGTTIGFNPLDLFGGSTGRKGKIGRRLGNVGETIFTISGRNKHRQYAVEMKAKGYLTEHSIRGVGRLDAVDLDRRIIRELKPNTPSGRYRGRRQFLDYLDRLEKQTGEKWFGYIDYYDVSY